MKRLIIIHAWGSSPEEHWYREEQGELESRGYEVSVPILPGGMWPKLPEWIGVINSLEVDEETIFIGHSLGLAAIFRYLEETKKKVAMVISIAGFAQDLGMEETKNFVEKPFDWDLIKNNVGKIVSIAQKNDPYVPIEKSKEIADKTGGKFVLVEGENHFDKMDLDLINREL